MRRVYTERHGRILDTLTRDFAGRLTALPSAGGLHLTAVIENGEATDDTAVVRRASARDVAVLPLSPHYIDAAARPGLLLGYGAIATADIDEGLRRLSACLP
jgi:GntR family transcriptional regulator/MocR family aminotransferase